VPKEKTVLVRQSMELLQFLLSLPDGMSRKDAKNLLRFKAVAVPGVPAPRHDTPLRAGTEIRIALGKHTPAGTVLPSGVEIVFEDEALLVINKPAGLLTIATESEKTRTAYAQITSYVQDRAPKGDARVFIVHRLDRDTSGLLIFARTEEVKFAFQRAWKSVTKKYHAIVQGTLNPPKGTLRSALVESDSLVVHSTRPENEDAKPAVTHYRTIRSGSEASLVELTLDTGRKNQIRVQLAEAGHPILGDEKYGATSDPARRLALHAVELHMRHPLTGEALDFESPMPDKLRGLLGKKEPVGKNPKQEAAQIEAAPARGNPVRGKPVRGNSGRGNPVRGNPVRGNPVRGNPVRGNPVRGNSGRGNPERGNPERGNPVRGNPERGNPVRGNSGRGNPERGNPERGNPGRGKVATEGNEARPKRRPTFRDDARR
jgi:23S rRNA pseudouridine1911/1915/1917 synthase